METKTYNNLLVEIEDGIALVTINRPKSLNALNSETLWCYSRKTSYKYWYGY